MGSPVRPEQPADPGRIARNVAALKAQGASDDDVEAYLTKVEKLAPVEQESLPLRVAHQVSGFAQQALEHPLDTAGQLIAQPLKSAFHAVVSPEIGEARPNPNLSKGGNSSGAPLGGTYDAAHGGITEGERNLGGIQTAANIAAPGLGGKVAGKLASLGAPKLLSSLLGLATTGAPIGAAYSPNDPVAGAVSGSLLTALLGGAGKAAGAVGEASGSKLLDAFGRPEQSKAVQIGPVKVGNVTGIQDRATQQNAAGLSRSGLSAQDLARQAAASDKPVTTVDLAGTAGQRMARGLKTSSPAAETTIRGALEPRTEGAVERVIEQAKDLTGIKRQNAYETHQALKQRTIDEGDEAYGKVWGDDQGGTITDPKQLAEIEKLKSTPAGAQGLALAQKMMANDGVETAAPSGIPPDQLAMLQKAAARQGIKLPGTGGPTLQSLHYWKLALDDLKRPGLDRGEGAGGIGYNMGKSIHGVQKRLLGVMDQANQGYADARAQYAGNKEIENASEAGQSHWTRDPAESKAMLDGMSPAEQGVYRDQAFDQWAQRVENGPENVGKSQSKSLNARRLRLLFPDDESFGKFKQGLQGEMQMHATDKGVLTGSNTADKLADMADMAGVNIPAVFKAMRGNPIPLAGSALRHVMSSRMRASADALAVERARQLTAGANGDKAALTQALQKIGGAQAIRPVQRPAPSMLAGLLTPKASDQ